MIRLLATVKRFFAAQEPWFFVAALATVLAVWGFAVITSDVINGDTQKFDRAVLLALRQHDNPEKLIGPPWTLTVTRDLTALGGAVVLGLVVGGTLGFLLLVGRYKTACFLLVATGGATALNVWIKGLVDRPRPVVVPHLTDVSSASFPSGHSAVSAAVYLTLGALLAQSVKKKRVKLYFVFVALGLAGLVGVSRVALGVHYPSDVLAGWASGLCWALLCWLAARYLQRRGAIEKEADAMPEPADARSPQPHPAPHPAPPDPATTRPAPNPRQPDPR